MNSQLAMNRFRVHASMALGWIGATSGLTVATVVHSATS